MAQVRGNGQGSRWRQRPWYRTRMDRLKWRLGFFCVLFSTIQCVYLVGDYLNADMPASLPFAGGGQRVLLSDISIMGSYAFDGPGCGSESKMGKGGIPIWFLGTLYTFFGLAIVCDDYFVDSLERISIALDLSDDVAGATFMAAGSSAPELFTSLIGVFFTNPADNPGPGTIVGSAVFNITIIIGITAASSKTVLDLDWWPLSRDSAFYSLSIILLLLTFLTGSDYNQIDWWEGLYLTLAYFGYILLMKYNSKIVTYINSKREGKIRAEHNEMVRSTMDHTAPLPYQRFRGLNPRFRSVYRQGVEAVAKWKEEERRALENGEELDEVKKEEGTGESKAKIRFKNAAKSAAVVNAFKENAKRQQDEREAEAADEDNGSESSEESGPKTAKEWFLYIISLPWLKAFKYTIPNSATPKWAKWYPMTFTMSIVWIGIISFFMVDFAGKLGKCVGIPGPVMGLTFLAAGTSVPDTFSSVLVARDGKGDMAVSNAIGSNVFDILLGLGFPWFLWCLSQGPGPLCMNVGGIVVYTIVLFVVLFALFGVLIWKEFKLTNTVGYVLFVIYVGFATYGLVDAFALKQNEQDDTFCKCLFSLEKNPDDLKIEEWLFRVNNEDFEDEDGENPFNDVLPGYCKGLIVQDEENFSDDGFLLDD